MPDDDLIEVKKVIEDLNKDWEEFKQTRDTQLSESVKGYVDPLLEEKLKKINTSLDELGQKTQEAYLASKEKTVSLDGQKVDLEELDKKSYQWAVGASAYRQGKNMPDAFGLKEAKEYKSAFETYIREGSNVLSPDEVKALSVGSDPDGGYVVDPDTTGRLVRKVFETSPVRSIASTQIISSESLDGMYDLEETAFGWVGETASRTETATPQIGMWNIPVHEMYAEPRITQKLLDDASMDMESWLSDKIADRFARAENTAFVLGTGVNQPRGFLTYPAGTTNPGQVVQVVSGADGAFASDPDGLDAFLDMIYGLKAPYRANGTFVMNRTVTGEVRKLKTSDGFYQWQPSAQAGQPDRLYNYPVVSLEDMVNLSTDSLSVAFGDFAEAYQIVDRIGIRTIRDNLTAKPFIKLYSTKRTGGDVVNFEAFNIMKFNTA